tara:strand:+ start:9135 stop:9374 length:240 start_codon:yes stop_codon:yes gene_type:complete
MEYKYADIEKITEFKSWSVSKKIDELFRIDAHMYTELGLDSSKKDKKDTRSKSKSIYRAIQKIDPKLGKDLIYYIDRED